MGGVKELNPKLSLLLGGDPRGYTVKVLGLPTYNTWGGVEEGFGVA